MTNREIVNKFYAAHKTGTIEDIKSILDSNVEWTFLSQHPLGGVKRGHQEVLNFFHKLNIFFNGSDKNIERMVWIESENHMVEYLQLEIPANEGFSKHQICILWQIKDGKIISGKHFFSDPTTANIILTNAEENNNLLDKIFSKNSRTKR